MHYFSTAFLCLFAASAQADVALFAVRGVGTSADDQRAAKTKVEQELHQAGVTLRDQSKNASCADDESCRSVVLKRMKAKGLALDLFRIGPTLSISVVLFDETGAEARRYEQSTRIEKGNVIGEVLDADATAFLAGPRPTAPLAPANPADEKQPSTAQPADAPTNDEGTPPSTADAAPSDSKSAPGTPPPNASASDGATPQGDAAETPQGAGAETPANVDAAAPADAAAQDAAQDGSNNLMVGSGVAIGGAVAVVGALVIVAVGAFCTGYAYVIRSDPKTLGTIKESAQPLGYFGLAALAGGAISLGVSLALTGAGVAYALTGDE